MKKLASSSFARLSQKTGAVDCLTAVEGTRADAPLTGDPHPLSLFQEAFSTFAGATAAAEGKRSAAVDGGAPAKLDNPPSVTRGESSPSTNNQQASKIDWLNCTFPAPDRYTPAQLVAVLSRLFRRPIRAVQERGIFGFTHSVKMIASVGSTAYPIGCIAYGGEDQKGRVMLQLTGSGCGVVRDWARFSRLLQALQARITRLDLAVDYLDGQYSVDDAVAMYKTGQFSTGGRNPSSSVAGDWLDGVKGRTLYVGKAANGKMLRVYEKGIQLGQIGSPWVRFECQLGNRDRVIPFAAMTERDAYFSGCYPALEKMLGCASEHIRTTRTEGHVTLGHLMFHLKRSYGKLLNTVTDLTGVAFDALFESVTVLGAPRRSKFQFSAVGGLTWAQLHAQFTNKATA